jgi:hypothetical protein
LGGASFNFHGTVGGYVVVKGCAGLYRALVRQCLSQRGGFRETIRRQIASEQRTRRTKRNKLFGLTERQDFT